MSKRGTGGGKQRPYIRLYNDILDLNLSWGQKVTLAALENMSRQRGFVWASNEAIAEQLNANCDSIRRWLSDLEEAGFIKRKQEGNERRIYVVRDRDLQSLSTHKEDSDGRPTEEGGQNAHLGKMSTLGGQNAHPRRAKCPPPLYRKEKLKEKGKEPPNPPQGGGGCFDPCDHFSSRGQTEGFAQFWDAYPKKENQYWAQRAWTELAPSGSQRETIMQALNKHKKQPRWLTDGGRYIPSASSWLRNEQWRNEPELSEPRRPSATGSRKTGGRRISYERTYTPEQYAKLFVPIERLTESDEQDPTDKDDDGAEGGEAGRVVGLNEWVMARVGLNEPD